MDSTCSGRAGLSPALISPRWNNNDGGADLDSSRCPMGHGRFVHLMAMPPGTTIVGIDEHTALILDLASEDCRVMGRGGASLLRGGSERRFEHGHSFPQGELGPFVARSHMEGWRARPRAPRGEARSTCAVTPRHRPTC